MLKRMSVLFCGAAFAVMTAGYATAQTATQEAKEKTKTAADKTKTTLTDAEITSAVKTKLLADSTVGGLKLDVDTEHGVVTLSGPVHSAAERAQAVKLAHETKGVKSVKNNLKLDTAGTTGRTDKDDKVKAEAKEDAAKAKEKTKDAGEKTKDVSKEAAQKTKDAAVKTKDVTADAAITSEVKTKLLGDTKVGGLKIDVDTKDNVVTLTGTVSSAAEKAEAIRLAKTTTGVKSVVDKLVVK
jgi:hyperosmotically inducible protein